MNYNPDIEEQNIGQAQNPWAYNGSMNMPVYRDQREQDLRGLMDAFPDPRIQKFLQRRLDSYLNNTYGFIPNDSIRPRMAEIPSYSYTGMRPQQGMVDARTMMEERMAAEEAARQRQLGGGGGNGGGGGEKPPVDYWAPYAEYDPTDSYETTGVVNGYNQQGAPSGSNKLAYTDDLLKRTFGARPTYAQGNTPQYETLEEAKARLAAQEAANPYKVGEIFSNDYWNKKNNEAQANALKRTQQYRQG